MACASNGQTRQTNAPWGGRRRRRCLPHFKIIINGIVSAAVAAPPAPQPAELEEDEGRSSVRIRAGDTLLPVVVQNRGGARLRRPGRAQRLESREMSERDVRAPHEKDRERVNWRPDADAEIERKVAVDRDRLQAKSRRRRERDRSRRREKSKAKSEFRRGEDEELREKEKEERRTDGARRAAGGQDLSCIARGDDEDTERRSRGTGIMINGTPPRSSMARNRWCEKYW
ncbi:hypothetical protein B0H16DRAFT_1699699 [Mycena metata]|uniref:Uncharacterized protein n=1 Tax=Mycena metata TaxID=1033252 RepID=A0AAD7HJL8_9AGAR|nr:hypothetical protein B0H16DRAFT_1699699 [Mycena metata]